MRMIKLNHDGFSLAETLVASSVGLVAILGIASSMSYSSRSAQTISAKLDFNSLVTTIESVLNNSTNCLDALKNVVFNNPPVAPGGAVDISLLPLTTDGGAGTVLVPNGLYGKTLNVTQLKIIHSVPLASGHLVTIELIADRLVGGDGGAIGNKQSKHQFKATVAVDPAPPNKIIACSGVSSELWKKGVGTDIYYDSGKVGIGTNAPGSPLHVMSNVNSDPTILVENRNPGASTMASLDLQADFNKTQLQSESLAHGGYSSLQTNAHTLRLSAYEPNAKIDFFVGDDWLGGGPDGWKVNFKHDSALVGVGVTVDFRGVLRMTKFAAQPFACDAAHDGYMAVTSGYKMCICKPVAWVMLADGATACTW